MRCTLTALDLEAKQLLQCSWGLHEALLSRHEPLVSCRPECHLDFGEYIHRHCDYSEACLIFPSDTSNVTVRFLDSGAGSG